MEFVFVGQEYGFHVQHFVSLFLRNDPIEETIFRLQLFTLPFLFDPFDFLAVPTLPDDIIRFGSTASCPFSGVRASN